MDASLFHISKLVHTYLLWNKFRKHRIHTTHTDARARISFALSCKYSIEEALWKCVYTCWFSHVSWCTSILILEWYISTIACIWNIHRFALNIVGVKTYTYSSFPCTLPLPKHLKDAPFFCRKLYYTITCIILNDNNEHSVRAIAIHVFESYIFLFVRRELWWNKFNAFNSIRFFLAMTFSSLKRGLVFHHNTVRHAFSTEMREKNR